MIRLTITKEVPNEQFEKEMEEYNRDYSRSRNNGMGIYEGPKPVKVVNALDVHITEEQWVAIKKAVIETF